MVDDVNKVAMSGGTEYEVYWAGYDAARAGKPRTNRGAFDLPNILPTHRLAELFERGWYAAKDGEPDLRASVAV